MAKHINRSAVTVALNALPWLSDNASVSQPAVVVPTVQESPETVDHGDPGTISDALKNFSLLPDDAHVRQPVVEALFACSPATVWRMVKRGTLPAPKKFSARVSAWNVGELRKVLAK